MQNFGPTLDLRNSRGGIQQASQVILVHLNVWESLANANGHNKWYQLIIEARTLGCCLWILSLFAHKQIRVKLSLAFASWLSIALLTYVGSCLSFLVTTFSFSKNFKHSLSILLILAFSCTLSQCIQLFQLDAAYLYCELTSTDHVYSSEPRVTKKSIRKALCLLQSPLTQSLILII